MSENNKTLRNLQLTELDMLLDVVNVCDSNGITYYLSSGTLLGAVRHKGFIPWDDDIDIEIPIEDYRRFLEIAQAELGSMYFVQNFITDSNFNLGYTRIRKNNTTYLDPYQQNHKIHHGVWIDVFPLVAVNPGLSVALKRKWLTACNFVQIQENIDAHKEEFQHLLGPIGMLAMKTFSKSVSMDNRKKLHNAMLNAVFNANPNRCSYRANVWGNITTIFPKEVYEGAPSNVEFEGHILKAPHDYIRYLEIKYGDYMTLPPEDQRKGHGSNMILDLENSYEKYMVL